MSDAEIHREIEGVDVIFRFSSTHLGWSFEADGLAGHGWGSLHSAIQHVRTQLQTQAKEKSEATVGLRGELRRILRIDETAPRPWIDVVDAPEQFGWPAEDLPFIWAALKDEK